MFKIIAHRSGPTIYPEQTIASARLAMNNDADLIEIDVRFTSDNAIVICHDSNADRIFGINKDIKDMTGQEFLSLRHKSHPEYPSHLFEDYLKCGIAPLLIHVKEGGEKLGAIIKCIEKYNYSDKVVLGVSTTEDVKTAKLHNIRALAFMPNAECIEDFAASGADYIRLWEAWVSEENVSRIRKCGKELWIMACGEKPEDVGITTKESIKKWLDMNVDGILINDIDFLKI